jgi:iron(III) transport system ATP-binding protein
VEPVTCAVRVDRVTKRFEKRAVVDAVSLTVTDREAVVLVGPSGCGKTTLLRLIAGLETPDEGVIELAGHVASEGRRVALPPRRRGIGYVFQDLALWSHMTVVEHLRFALEPLGLSRSAERERIASTLELVQIAALGSRHPHKLSGGEQQRVAIARAIVAHPRLLLLDEPFSSLDADLRDELRRQLADLQRDLALTMIAVTHDVEDARVLGHRTIRMRGGRIEAGL